MIGAAGVGGGPGVAGYRVSAGYGGGSSSTMPPSLCWMMMSGPISGIAPTAGNRNDAPARRGAEGNVREFVRSSLRDRCTRGRDDGPATGVEFPLPEPDPEAMRERAACASAYASRTLR